LLSLSINSHEHSISEHLSSLSFCVLLSPHSLYECKFAWFKPIKGTHISYTSRIYEYCAEFNGRIKRRIIFQEERIMIQNGRDENFLTLQFHSKKWNLKAHCSALAMDNGGKEHFLPSMEHECTHWEDYKCQWSGFPSHIVCHSVHCCSKKMFTLS
jgi:phosphopantetheinyl transferase (holo-ACP synthase)